MRWAVKIGVLLGAATSASAQAPAPAASAVLQAMKTELARSLQALRAQPTPPYFLSYDITEVHNITLAGAFGAITERAEGRQRALDVDVRVGDYAFDNTHPGGGRFPDFPDLLGFGSADDVPVDDNPDAIRAALWVATDRQYHAAVSRLQRIRAGNELRVAAEDSSPDFSREPPERFSESSRGLVLDQRAWEARIRRYTAPFARHADIYGGNAILTATVETRWYVTSDGAELQTSQPMYRLQIWAYSKADDGMELPRYESFFAFTPDKLPDDQTVLRAVDRMIADLQALRRAPVMEPYTGPAILSGRASAVFFHEILGHRLEGHRQKREEESKTFARRVNDAILPPGFSVSFDPTLARLRGTDLAGYYRYDDEGVRARRVSAIDHGVLKTFLMSRAPIEGFANSNAHGRRQVGFQPVARQSNLIVDVAEPRTRAQLKQMLIDQVRRDGKPFGLFFDDIEGGFTITTRGFPNAFEVLPIMVYRVFPDGREELVRGVDLIGTPLTVFSKITAGDDQVEVFNGLCGAESGLVPVSAVSPGVFVSQIEVQKKPKATDRGPILTPPPQAAVPARADTGDPVLRAMRDELARSMAELRLDTFPRPYFIAYRVDEVTSLGAAATRGSLLSSSQASGRYLSVEVRVGDYAFDNTNFFGAPGRRRGRLARSGDDAPLDDDYAALRRQFWLATDGSYKTAVEALARKKAAVENRTRRDSLPDFSREDVVTVRDDPPPPRIDRATIEQLVRDASAVFRETPEIYESGVAWSGAVVRTWYVNSEGTSFVRTAPVLVQRTFAGTRAADGTSVQDGTVAYGRSPAELPGRAASVAAARDLAARLMTLRSAPPAERYEGPILFEGEAAVQLVGDLFAPMLAGERAPVADDPMFEQMMGRRMGGFQDRLGGRVLPTFLSVTDNPTVRTFEGQPLGGYVVDDEGVRARETKVVERGILRTLLTTRVPLPGMPRSTGNRRGSDAAVSNLFVTADSGLTTEQLRRQLLALAAARGAPYAVVVRRIADPSAMAADPMAFFEAMAGAMGEGPSFGAAVAVKVFPDGREEPVRGGRIAELTTASFRDIVAASRARTVGTLPAAAGFTGRLAFAMMRPGMSFASGPGYTASYVVPSLLFEEVTLEPGGGAGRRPPLLAPPWAPQR
jgi:predicted Zn-dependent protease